MSTGSSYAHTSAASRPIITPGAQRNFQTWSSIDHELASHSAPPRAWGFRSLRGALCKKDRALFREAVLNIVVPLGAALVAIGTGVSFGVSIAYWFF